MGNKQLYTPLTPEEYDEQFGVYTKDNKLQKKALKKVPKKSKVKALKKKWRKLNQEALKKAWEIRNFEIDKFWQRSAYFWGFIVIFLGGYITVANGKFSEIKDLHLDLYLILLGLIFSVGWLLVIRGSKRWQDNWEAHVDRLENAITGPLYKTVYCTKHKFYSVSKINEILALVIIIIWGLLLVQHVFVEYIILEDILKWVLKHLEIILFVCVPIILTIVGISTLIIKGQTEGGEFKVNLKEDQKGEFINRAEFW